MGTESDRETIVANVEANKTHAVTLQMYDERKEKRGTTDFS